MSVALFACNEEPNEGETTDGTINIGGEETTAETGEEGSEIESEFNYDDTKNPGDYQYVEKNDTIYVLAPSGALNLRTADYQKKTSVKTGTALQRVAVSTDGVWSKIIYTIDNENLELYVNNKYTTLLADLDAGFVACEKTLTLKTAGLKIHIAPEADEKWQADVKIVGYYAADDEIKVLAENTETGYYKVEFTAYGGVTAIGYISNDPDFFVAPAATEAATETATEAATQPEAGK